MILLGVLRCRAMMDLWENGRSEPRASEVQALATALQVSIAALYEPQGSEG
jgi:transcriptional regulator with XRE-family HTH domain